MLKKKQNINNYQKKKKIKRFKTYELKNGEFF